MHRNQPSECKTSSICDATRTGELEIFVVGGTFPFLWYWSSTMIKSDR